MISEDTVPISASMHDEIVRQLRALADKIENREVYVYLFWLTGTNKGIKLEIESG